MNLTCRTETGERVRENPIVTQVTGLLPFPLACTGCTGDTAQQRADAAADII